VSEELDGEGAAASEDQKASGGGTESADHPECALHVFASCGSDSDLRESDASWRLDADEILALVAGGELLL